MNLAAFKFLIVSSLLVSITACGGRSKPDRSAQPVAAPQATAEPADPYYDQAENSEGTVATPATPSENSDLTLDDPNGKIATKTKATKAPVPYAEENTEYVGDVADEVKKQKKASGMAPVKTGQKAAKSAGVPAETAMRYLRNGNTRYVKQRTRADGQKPADRARLLAGQNPHAIVLTCSDSRVPPEIIFDQKLGEIYVVRTEQLTADKAILWSLEKGAALGAQLLVVLSHADCSADTIKASGGITTQSAALAELVNTGNLTIQPATYNLKSGVVTFE